MNKRRSSLLFKSSLLPQKSSNLWPQVDFALNYLNFLSSEIIKDWLVKPLRDQHVKPKAKATFKGELFKDTPNWKWYKGENELAPSDKVEITKDGKDVMLTINNCQPTDVSDYTIQVEDRRYTAKLTLGGWLNKSLSQNLPNVWSFV